MKTKVLIVHLEGNVLNNPSLYSIVTLLSQNGFAVDILSKLRFVGSQDVQIPNVQIHTIDFRLDDSSILTEVKKFLIGSYSLIVGVDQSIVPASQIANKLKVPLVFVSYEIFFKDEVGEEYKALEITACKNIAMAIIQDPLRARLIEKEYGIPYEKSFFIPVAGKFEKNPGVSDYLRTHLSIPVGKKIVLFAGSISAWGMTGELIKQSSQWSDNWVLVLHDRFGRVSEEVQSLVSNHKNVIISTNPVDSVSDLEELISSADVGLALYKSNLVSKYEGKNLIFMGLSSGKIATYLLYGLPVITNLQGQIADLLNTYKSGAVISDVSQISNELLDSIAHKANRDKCVTLFKEKLDFSLFEKDLLENFRQLSTAGNSSSLVKESNKVLEYTFSNGFIEQVYGVFHLGLEVFRSNIYQTGKKIHSPKKYFFSIIKKLLVALRLRKEAVSPVFNDESIRLSNIIKKHTAD